MLLLPPLLFPAGDRTGRARLETLKKQGIVRSVGPRLYTSVAKKDLEKTVRNNWAVIVSNLFPDAILSHRSALEYLPTEDGIIYLTGFTNREVDYPGLTLKFIRGAAPLEDDPDFLNFHASSVPRALLENLSTVRKGSRQKVIPQRDLEHRLEMILHHQGEAGLNKIRARARAIAKVLNMQREFAKLDSLIGALLSTRTSQNLQSEVGKARAKNFPYDSGALTRFQVLFSELRNFPFPVVKEALRLTEHFSNKAFFEAYFSNFIEGTMFEIEEAEEIIFDKKIPKARPKDAHDIVGTFTLVADPNEMDMVPTTADGFIDILTRRHQILLKQRPEVCPGVFKQKPNRAGSTEFVAPEYVRGTLCKAFDLYRDLPAGMARAVFVMFVVTDVHPFVDGNGRIARVMMNSELTAKRLATIIIPNVYREDYVGALRALTRRERAQPLVKVMVLAQKFSAIKFHPYPAALNFLRDHNWFAEPSEAKIVVSNEPS